MSVELSADVFIPEGFWAVDHVDLAQLNTKAESLYRRCPACEQFNLALDRILPRLLDHNEIAAVRLIAAFSLCYLYRDFSFDLNPFEAVIRENIGDVLTTAQSQRSLQQKDLTEVRGFFEHLGGCQTSQSEVGGIILNNPSLYTATESQSSTFSVSLDLAASRPLSIKQRNQSFKNFQVLVEHYINAPDGVRVGTLQEVVHHNEDIAHVIARTIIGRASTRPNDPDLQAASLDCTISLSTLPVEISSFNLLSRLLRNSDGQPLPGYENVADAVRNRILGPFLRHASDLLDLVSQDPNTTEELANGVHLYCLFCQSAVLPSIQEMTDPILVEMQQFAVRYSRFHDAATLYQTLMMAAN